MAWLSQLDGSEDEYESGSLRLRERRRRRSLREEGHTEDSADAAESMEPSHGAGLSADDDDRHNNRPAKPALVCTAESVKLLVTLLACLFQGKKDQRVRCDVDQGGMLFTSHSRGKSLQIKTSLGNELFDTYHFDGANVNDHDDEDDEEEQDGGEQVSFALNLNALIECLSMFGPAALPTSSLRLSYYPATASLTLVIEDNGVICECSMQVLELEGNDLGQLEFETAFEQSAVVARCIMQSEPLHDAFAELYDLPSAATVTIAMFSDKSHGGSSSDRCLSLSATSETGSCEIDFARSSSAFIEFYCAGEVVADNADGAANGSAECAATFHVAVLQQAFKALGNSNETFLRMNAEGFLSVQHMIDSGTGDKAFVDALISPEDTSIA